jgi:hypothetical protein
MVPVEFVNYFLASAGAGAALVGLLFVAVSIAPERTVMETAPLERQAMSASAFVALVNAFFISMAALIPASNLGWTTFVMALVSLVNTLGFAWILLRQRDPWQQMLRRVFMFAVSLTLYGFELYYAMQLLQSPSQSGPIFILAALLLGIYGIGLLRAWELLGARRYGLSGWLNPLRTEDTKPTSEQADREKSAANGTTSQETVKERSK